MQKHRIFGLIWVWCFVLAGTQVSSQSNYVPTKLDCGDYKTNLSATSLSPDSMGYDRFGNIVNIYPPSTSTLIPEENVCNSGYFTLNFYGTPPQGVQDVVCKVMQDLSGVILQRDNERCGNSIPQKVVIQVLWGDFSNPNDPLWSQFGITDLMPNRLGIGTSIYQADSEGQCRQIMHNAAYYKINGIRTDNTASYSAFQWDGRILLNSNPVSNTLPVGCSSLGWNTSVSSTNFPCEFDLYSVVLHEILHVIGVSSGVKQGFSTEWDKRLHLSNQYPVNNATLTPVLEPQSPDCKVNCWNMLSDIQSIGEHSCEAGNPYLVVGEGSPLERVREFYLVELQSRCSIMVKLAKINQEAEDCTVYS